MCRDCDDGEDDDYPFTMRMMTELWRCSDVGDDDNDGTDVDDDDYDDEDDAGGGGGGSTYIESVIKADGTHSHDEHH